MREEQRNKSFSRKFLRTKVVSYHSERKRKELKESRAKIEEEMQNPDEKFITIKTNFDKLYDGRLFSEEIAEVANKLESLPTVEREVINSLWDSLGGLRDYFTQISFTMSNYDQWNFKQVTSVSSANHKHGKYSPKIELENSKN